jgi:hypothetical protein
MKIEVGPVVDFYVGVVGRQALARPECKAHVSPPVGNFVRSATNVLPSVATPVHQGSLPPGFERLMAY